MTLPSTPVASRSRPLARCLLLTSALSCASLAATNVAKASSDGRLDPGFGIGGVVTLETDFAPSGVAASPDGGVVLSGVLQSESRAALMRVDANGALVASWGQAGVARIPDIEQLGLQSSEITRFSNAFLLPDGRWLAVGSIQNVMPSAGSRLCPLLVAFNADGSHDVTFGAASGGAICPGEGSVPIAGDPFVPGPPAAVLSGERVFVSDSSVIGGGGSSLPLRVHAVDFSGVVVADFGVGGRVDMPGGIPALSLDVDALGALYAGSLLGVARFSSQGVLDSTFGAAGVATLSLPAPWEVLYGSRIRVLQDRVLALGGLYAPQPSFRSLSFVRMAWSSDGMPLTGVDSGKGPVVAGLSAWSSSADAQLAPHLSASEVGAWVDGSGRSVLLAQEMARLTASGGLDARFGDAGRAAIGWAQPSFQALTQDLESRIWVARRQHQASAGGHRLELLRFLADSLFSDGFEDGVSP